MALQITESDVDYRTAVAAIVLEELELEESEISDSGHFIEDYEADSLSLITVVARIEKELGVAIPKTELGKLTSLELLIGAVHANAGESKGA
ncbi:acyl carrier protein [Kitasatospora sp. SUK 42]|uniref:acyl carrier protein n=1 Tax=Kitasatospora sp. SUK 42 TaxID=1588882 RepID=UPI0018CAE036|nr:acyl carrier protein [Kitasatospora sp. SUK 42]MBV2154814.1 acyl carrier protein [Kitasatospora sp. SUK 42]